MAARDSQVGGEHYKKLPIQPFEMAAANDYDSFALTILKYVTRHKGKGGLEDCRKAVHVAELRQDLHGSTPPISIEDYIRENVIPQDDALILRFLDNTVKHGDDGFLVRALGAWLMLKEVQYGAEAG